MAQRLRIAHLYPEQMNIYGDRGNILALARRCAWRGIEAEIVPVGVGMECDWVSYDLAFFGGGQDSGQVLIAEDFVLRQGPALRDAIDDGLVMLAVCGGYQLLGHYFLTHTGERLSGIGALDLYTIGGTERLIGNVVIETTEIRARRDSHPDPITRLVGFENHSGRTYLGPGVRPLGQILVGHGNNGKDGTEGAVYRNTFGCYLHGALLPKNPQLTDHLIELALQRRYGQENELSLLDDRLELSAQQTMIARLVK